jgi:hypothetical protein
MPQSCMSPDIFWWFLLQCSSRPHWGGSRRARPSYSLPPPLHLLPGCARMRSQIPLLAGNALTFRVPAELWWLARPAERGRRVRALSSNLPQFKSPQNLVVTLPPAARAAKVKAMLDEIFFPELYQSEAACKRAPIRSHNKRHLTGLQRTIPDLWAARPASLPSVTG